MAQDIFDVDNLGSLVRQIIREKKVIKLADFDIQPYKIPHDYRVTEFRSPEAIVHTDHLRHVRAAIEPICQEAEKLGYPGNLFTALYEAVLNAYRHGNQRDPNKRITIAHKITSHAIEIAVIDEGGTIDPELIPFVLRHREGRHKIKDGVLDFYKFTGREKPPENNGTGTLFMHLYADKVAYYKSEAGGLVVHLTKYKDK